jgi:hypothetical protein
MHNTPNKTPHIKDRYIQYVHTYSNLKNLHTKIEEKIWRVAAQYVNLDFTFDPEPPLSLNGLLVPGKEGESVSKDE